MLYMVTFTINIPPIFACLPYMDPMGNNVWIGEYCTWRLIFFLHLYTLQASISKSMSMTNSKKHAARMAEHITRFQTDSSQGPVTRNGD